MRQVKRTLLIIVFSVLLGVSVWQICSILGSYQAGQESYENLEQYVSFTEPPALETTAPTMEETASQTDPSETPPLPTEEPDDTVWPSVDFEHLSQINPDVVGWIYIEGTSISYPIVQGENDEFYLNHLFDGSYNRSGCIFLDEENTPDFSDKHSIIYGHNMKDKAMFAGLMNYKDQTFYDEHPLALIITPTHKYKVRLFSGYVADASASAWKMTFPNNSFPQWLAQIQAKSCFQADCAPSADDRIVTLSTCTYEFDSARFVIHGYIERIIENTDP